MVDIRARADVELDSDPMSNDSERSDWVTVRRRPPCGLLI